MGPAVSWLEEMGMMPVRLTSPTVGLRPTMPLLLAGQTMEPLVSVPMATTQRLAATATPEPGARTAGVAVQHVGVAGLAAHAAPAARGKIGAEVGPFAHVGLGQDDRPGRPQLFGHPAVFFHERISQHGGAGRGRHRVKGIDVVLEDDRDAVQRAPGLAGLHLGVQFGRDLQGVGVDAKDRIEPGPAAVDGLDALQVALHDIAYGEPPFHVALLQLPDGDLLQVDAEGRLGGRIRRSRSRRKQTRGRKHRSGSTG